MSSCTIYTPGAHACNHAPFNDCCMHVQLVLYNYAELREMGLIQLIQKRTVVNVVLAMKCACSHDHALCILYILMYDIVAI